MYPDGDRVIHVTGSTTVVEVEGLTVTGGHDLSDSGAGGIVNEGVLTLRWVSVVDNRGEMGAGGILNNGSLAVFDSRVAGNDVGMGGAGILSGDGSLRVERSGVVDNGSCAPTGGIRNWDGEALIIDSYVAFNNGEPRGDAGGITTEGPGS